MIDIRTIDALCAGRFGVVDCACPECGPGRRSALNRRRRTLRVWRDAPGFASYACARCGATGFTRDGACSPPSDSAKLAKARAEAAERERTWKAQRLDLARWLWQRRQPIAGTAAETYLRMRGYCGALPATLGFLQAHGEHAPALIAAFGIASEPEPGVLAIGDDAVRGVHLTKLKPDGSGKAGSGADKIMIGASAGSPIVVAAPNDSLGLAVCEGIEDALSMYTATGLGAWAAGAANRMPALGNAVPPYIEAVTIAVDDDEAGRRGADGLSAILMARGIEVRLCRAGSTP